MANEILLDVAEDDPLVELLWSRSSILLMQILQGGCHRDRKGKRPHGGAYCSR